MSVNAGEFHSVVVGEIAVMFAVEFGPDEDPPPPPQAVAKTQPAMALMKRIRVIAAKFYGQRMSSERAMRLDSRCSFPGCLILLLPSRETKITDGLLFPLVAHLAPLPETQTSQGAQRWRCPLSCPAHLSI